MNTAVVTGAATALGRAVATAFAESVDVLVLGVRNPDEGESLAATLGAETHVVRADPRDEFDVERLMEQASRAGDASGIDVVATCAAVHHGPVGETPLDEATYSAFDDTLRTNTRGVFAAIREAVPHLTADARVLVPTGSVAHGAAPGGGAFAVAAAATEAVVRGFSEDADVTVAALEVGQAAGTGAFDADATGNVFSWAATLPTADLDGARLTIEDWRAAVDTDQ